MPEFHNNPNRLIIFVKAFIKGKVKTRLAKSIGDDQALMLYKNFVADIVQAMKSGEFNIDIYFYPFNYEKTVKTWLGPGFEYFPQNGRDLGERMAEALSERLTAQLEKEYKKAVLIGSDFPDLPKSIIDEAFQALDAHDSVIGPTYDGGYYLIGFNTKTFSHLPFYDIPWSTKDVLKKTMNCFESMQYKVYSLPKWHDIDQLEDLKHFVKRVENCKTAPQTQACLRQLNLSALNMK